MPDPDPKSAAPDPKLAPDAKAPDVSKAADPATSTEGLVKMIKDGETSFVHPTTVAAHAAAAWRVV